jgi:hypothetical protein
MKIHKNTKDVSFNNSIVREVSKKISELEGINKSLSEMRVNDE